MQGLCGNLEFFSGKEGMIYGTKNGLWNKGRGQKGAHVYEGRNPAEYVMESVKGE